MKAFGSLPSSRQLHLAPSVARTNPAALHCPALHTGRRRHPCPIISPIATHAASSSASSEPGRATLTDTSYSGTLQDEDDEPEVFVVDGVVSGIVSSIDPNQAEVRPTIRGGRPLRPPRLPPGRHTGRGRMMAGCGNGSQVLPAVLADSSTGKRNNTEAQSWEEGSRGGGWRAGRM